MVKKDSGHTPLSLQPHLHSHVNHVHTPNPKSVSPPCPHTCIYRTAQNPSASQKMLMSPNKSTSLSLETSLHSGSRRASEWPALFSSVSTQCQLTNQTQLLQVSLCKYKERPYNLSISGSAVINACGPQSPVSANKAWEIGHPQQLLMPEEEGILRTPLCSDLLST